MLRAADTTAYAVCLIPPPPPLPHDHSRLYSHAMRRHPPPSHPAFGAARANATGLFPRRQDLS